MKSGKQQRFKLSQGRNTLLESEQKQPKNLAACPVSDTKAGLNLLGDQRPGLPSVPVSHTDSPRFLNIIDEMS